MKWRNEDEQGMALPIVIAVSTILSILLTLLVSQAVRHQQTENLFWERMRAQYAAESGIADMQYRLEHGQDRMDTMVIRLDDIEVQTQILNKDADKIHLQSTASSRYGVKQTIQVYLAPKTLEVIRWFR